MFFSGWCRQRATEVLLGPDNFVDLLHGEHGFEIRYRCHCGGAGVVRPALARVGSCGADRLRSPR